MSISVKDLDNITLLALLRDGLAEVEDRSDTYKAKSIINPMNKATVEMWAKEMPGIAKQATAVQAKTSANFNAINDGLSRY